MTPEQQHELLLNSPALKPPPGVIPNFIDPPSFKRAGYGISITLIAMTTTLVSIRLFTKARIVRRVALEDYILVFAWLAYCAGFNVVALMASSLHAGAHQWNFQVKQLIRFLYIFHACVITYNIVILPLKVSIILQCVRVFAPSGTRNVTFYVSHALIWINVVFYVTCTFLYIFSCSPQRKIYDPTIQGGHCFDSMSINISAAALNVISDGLMLILPQRAIWDLSMPMKRKGGLSAAFLVGVFTFGASIVRLYFTIRLKESPDLSHNLGLVGVWSFPEIFFGFLVACLPILPRFCSFVSKQPLMARTFATFRALFRITEPVDLKAQRPSMQGQGWAHQARPHQVSDVEFDELVVRRTGNSSVLECEYVGHGAVVWVAKDSSTQTSRVESA